MCGASVVFVFLNPAQVYDSRLRFCKPDHSKKIRPPNVSSSKGSAYESAWAFAFESWIVVEPIVSWFVFVNLFVYLT